MKIQGATTMAATLIFAAGSHMFKIGLEARWYEGKTYSHMAAREILLGIGRILGALILTPILFYNPEFFIPACTLMGGIILLSVRKMDQNRKIQTQAAEQY